MISDPLVNSRSSPSADSSQTPRRLVLVVDDEAPVRTVASMMLDHFGFDTIEAASGPAALAAFGDDSDGGRPPIDLVLLDLTLPGVPGLQVLERLRTLHPNLAVILSSGRAPGPLPAVAGPPVGFLLKPYTMAALEAALGQALATTPNGTAPNA